MRPAATQRVQLKIHRWFRHGKRLTYSLDDHTTTERAAIPTDLVGIMDALSRRARARVPARFVIHDLASGGVALAAWPVTRQKAGGIASVEVCGLHPPFPARKHPEIKGRVTLVPDALDDVPAPLHWRATFLEAFTEEQRQGWIYRRPRRNPEMTRRLRAISRLMRLVGKRKLTVAQLESFLLDSVAPSKRTKRGRQ